MDNKKEHDIFLEVDLDIYIRHSIFKIMSDSKYLLISWDSDITDFTEVNILNKDTTYFNNFDATILFSITKTDDGYIFKSHYNTHKDNYINISREIHTISDYQQAGKELANQIACSIMSYSSDIATELYSMITCLSI